MTARSYTWLLDPQFGGTAARTKDSGQLERRSIGELVLTSGQIVANDPLSFFQTRPFMRTVSPGRYPVSIFIDEVVHLNGQTSQLIAFALLTFRPEAPARWELALCAGDDVRQLKPGQFFGYGVDSGTGSFMDADTAASITALIDWDGPLYADPLSAELDKNYANTRNWANFVVDPATGRNVVAFSSGWGDGAYPSYWGLSAAGESLYLLTDFLLVAPDESS